MNQPARNHRKARGSLPPDLFEPYMVPKKRADSYPLSQRAERGGENLVSRKKARRKGQQPQRPHGGVRKEKGGGKAVSYSIKGSYFTLKKKKKGHRELEKEEP